MKTQKQIGIIASNYANENGYVTIDDLPIVISSVANYIKGLKEEGTVLWYEVNADNILIRFSSGFLLGFTPEVEGFQNGGSNVNIVTLQPFANSIGLSTTVIDYTAQYIDESLNNYTFQSNIDNEDVTIDTIISSLSNNQIVLWDGHGGFSDTYHSALVTGQKCDLSTDVLVLANKISKFLSYNKVSFLRDNTQGKLIPCSGIFPISRWAITSRFIDAYCHQMTNSLIWLGACYSGKDSVLASAFINKGATCVVGYSDTVVCFYHRAILTKTITSMLQINENTNDYFTLGEGVDIAKQTHGDNDKIKYSDVYHPKGAEPRIFGGEKAENYRLANVEESGKCGDDITYFLRNDGTLFLSGNGEMYNYDSADDVPWHNRRNNITSVEFEGDITSIGNRCIMNCGNLKNVNLPDTITSIGNSAFQNCSNLSSIDIPDSVTAIGSYAFAYSGLQTISLSDNLKAIPERMCSDCKKIKKVDIPNSVTSIGVHAFNWCTSIQELRLSNSLVSIGDDAFSGCTSLIELNIPNTVTRIGHYAFDCCRSLEKVSIPSSVSSLGFRVFNDCDKLLTAGPSGSNCDVEYGWTNSLPSCALQGSSKLRVLLIPNSITEITPWAFRNCDSLQRVFIPSSVKKIGYGAFECDSGVKLSEIYYSGSEEEWKNVKIDFNNSQISGVTVYYNSDSSSVFSRSSGTSNQETITYSESVPSSFPTPMHSPNASGTLSSTFDNLIPNANYLFVVSKSSSLDNMLDASNLLFIDEKTAGDSGSLTFGYIPREDYEGAVVKIFGPVNPSVTLDKTSATLKKGDKLTLTAMVDQEHSASDVGWASSNTGIATVSDSGEVTAVGFGDVEIIATLGDCAVKCLVSVVPELDFTILGASIRLIEPYGIRFGIQLGKGGDYANVKIVDYGTIMKPTELLDGEDLTLETGNVQKIPAKVIYSENDAMKIYTGVLINIPTTYFDTAISGRGYFIYEDENGVNHTVYTDIVSMSFNDVVNAAYQKYTSLPNPTDAQKEIIARLEVLRAMSVND